MATIKELQAIHLDKISSEPLRKALKEMLTDYDRAFQKKQFIQLAQDNMDKLYSLVEKNTPEAIPKNEEGKAKSNAPKKTASSPKKSKATPKKEAPKATRSTSEEFKKELSEIEQRIKNCRIAIRKYNEEKKKGQPPKPKPTRYKKIKSHLFSLANLIPKSLKDDPEAQKETERVLLKTHRGLMSAFQMNSVRRAKEVEKAIEEKFEGLKKKE